MLIDLYQGQSLRDRVLFNALLIASTLVTITAAAAFDLAHNEAGHPINNSSNPPLLPFTSAAPMPIQKTISAWSGRPTGLLPKLETPLCRRQYGVDLNKESCLDAWRSIPINIQSHTYGRRDRGNFEVPLPQRFLSGE